jgi:hypothetical protein
MRRFLRIRTSRRGRAAWIVLAVFWAAAAGLLSKTALFGQSLAPTLTLQRSDGATPPYHLTCKGTYQSEPLLSDTPLEAGLTSGVYLSSVGGVAFDHEAAFPKGLQIRDLKLTYDRTRVDGTRVRLVVNGHTYSTQGLPDWHLAPIAHYADTPHFAVVTLFGRLKGGQPKPPEAEYVVAYHPAFEDTLLGLRLCQGDFMLLDPNTMGELPRAGRNYLLGAGEQPPNMLQWMPAAQILGRVMHLQKFVSYVICDVGSPVTVDLGRRAGGRSIFLPLQGRLAFFFWNRGAPREERVVQADGTICIYRNSFEVARSGELSAAMARQTPVLRQVNPAIFEAMTNTMLYSALFRYCKKHDETMWREFVGAIDSIPKKEYAGPTPVLVRR